MIGFTATCLLLMGAGWTPVVEPAERCTHPAVQPRGFSGSSGERAVWRGGVDCTYTNAQGGTKESHVPPTVTDIFLVLAAASLTGLVLTVGLETRRSRRNSSRGTQHQRVDPAPPLK